MFGILLAAGRGTRMKSERSKVLYPINDEPMIMAPFRALLNICSKVVVVVGYRGPEVRETLMARAAKEFSENDLSHRVLFYTQDPPRGTGDAVKIAINGLGKNVGAEDSFLVLNADLPLIRANTLKKFVKQARDLKLSSACMSVRMKNPKGLGRIIRDEAGVFQAIREERDASVQDRRIKEVNGGVYFFDRSFLLENITTLESSNDQNEFYLTDLLGDRPSNRRKSMALPVVQSWDLAGVNTTYELARVRDISKARLMKQICEEKGVDFQDPASVLLSSETVFEGPAVVGPGVEFRGANKIASNVVIEGQCLVVASTIESGAKILWGSVVEESRVASRASIGPMAHLRPGSDVGVEAKVGNFVELKMTKLGARAKASHLSYLGDAEIGEDTNIGCGTITCNYDGVRKHRTRIGRGAFIGSDTQLVAPITVGDEAYVGSGTTLTEDVPAGALALSRPDLTIKPGYAGRLAQKLGQKKEST